MSTAILGANRHRCHTCGSGCIGTDVHINPQEREPLREQAADLGIENPLDGNRLRQVNRRCVFLADDHLCRIHSRFGPEAKPGVCQQYPLAVLEVGPLQMRAVIDPGCMHAWQEWQTGPEVEIRAAVMSNGRRLLAWEAEEEALVALIDPKSRTLAEILAALQASPQEFADRLTASDLARRLVHPDNSSPIRDRLAHVAAFIETLDRAPPLALKPTEEAWGIEVVRRFLFMRAARDGTPLSQAIVMLTGVYACGWADPDPQRFGPAMSAWSRAMRTDAWTTLFSSHTPQTQ